MRKFFNILFAIYSALIAALAGMSAGWILWDLWNPIQYPLIENGFQSYSPHPWETALGPVFGPVLMVALNYFNGPIGKGFLTLLFFWFLWGAFTKKVAWYWAVLGVGVIMLLFAATTIISALG